MRSLLSLCAVVFLITACTKYESPLVLVADPVASYKNGRLPNCYGSYRTEITRKDGTITLLEEKDALDVTQLLNDWRKPADGRSRGGVLFVHAPKINETNDPEFFYYVLEKSDEGKYCVSYGVTGDTPFNQKFLEKYGQKNV